jgi:hypothetical protein
VSGIPFNEVFLCPFLFAQAGVESGARMEKSSGRSILSGKERIGS